MELGINIDCITKKGSAVKESEIADSVLLSLFMNRNVKCSNAHAFEPHMEQNCSMKQN